MADDLLILNASELVTLKGPRRARAKAEMSDLSIVQDGAVAISDGVIVDVGKTESILRDHGSTGIEKIDASGKVVMPGFVDPHTHLVYAGSREFELELKAKGKSYMEILEGGGGILRTVRDTRDASPQVLFRQSAKRLESMLAHGSTTIEAKSGYGLDKDVEIRMLETIKRLDDEYPISIVPTYLGAHVVPPEFKGDGDAYVDFMAIEVLPDIARRKLAEFCDVFCEKGVFDVPQSRKVLLAAKGLGLGLKVHADEFSNSGGAQLAAEVGAISADHLDKPSDDGIMAMARRDTIGVLLPGTPFSSMSKDYADGRRLIDLGVPIALGTDLNPNCWNESMQFTISLACHKMRMTPAEAITAATINAAAALGLEKKIGSLEQGKRADVIMLDIPTHAHIPYKFGTNQVSLVIKGGRSVWER
ncbi:MAG: imidazolonepropionase [Euryarchaeota archaeon RBG_19FT_COMBO_56_21]|nr:MAG: imidazolonepropionase [Euryarchaeota archaeon RBG_19FT_COMBO_56_21]